jgi:hypothetical protein
MGFERNIRLFTKPHEAIFPLDLSKIYPYPEHQAFKSLGIETIFVHFSHGKPMQEIQLPKGMRTFANSTGKPTHKRFDCGMRLPKADGIQALNFHLSYDIPERLIDGYVDYYPTPEATGISHIELAFVVTFSPKDLNHDDAPAPARQPSSESLAGKPVVEGRQGT